MGITKEKTYKISQSTIVTTMVREDFLEPDFYQEFDYKQAAKDVIDSLDECYCITLIEELSKLCSEIIEDNKIRQKSIDEKYKIITEVLTKFEKENYGR